MKKFTTLLLAAGIAFFSMTAAQADSWTFENTHQVLIDQSCQCTWSFDD